MPDSATAEIIRFPMRAAVPLRAPAAPVAADPANARLARALDNLNEALAGQRAAMAAWKTAIGDLRTVTRRLGTSLRGYNDSLGRLDVLSHDVPIRCGRVLVNPGDLVLADDDGVVIVPRSVADQALALAEEKARGENLVREALASGMSVTEAFRRYGIL